MPFCSIIVPVYKTEEYLTECIHSILQQTLDDFELILVDDGSPDQCPEICDSFARTDSRIHAVHKINGGVSSARNTGLGKASGEYIWFVDSDDYIQPHSISHLFAATQKNDADLIVFNCNNVTDYYTGSLDEFLRAYYFPYILGFASWNKLYRRSVIEEKRLSFDEEEFIGEDLLFNLNYFEAIMGNAKEGCSLFLGQDYYVYNKRADSAMNTGTKNRLEQQLRLFRKTREVLRGDVSDLTIAYLFLLHLISGIQQSKPFGLKCDDFCKVNFTLYGNEIDKSNCVLKTFFANEKTSYAGKARLKLFCYEMKKKNYQFAGRIMGLE